MNGNDYMVTFFTKDDSKRSILVKNGNGRGIIHHTAIYRLLEYIKKHGLSRIEVLKCKDVICDETIFNIEVI